MATATQIAREQDDLQIRIDGVAGIILDRMAAREYAGGRFTLDEARDLNDAYGWKFERPNAAGHWDRRDSPLGSLRYHTSLVDEDLTAAYAQAERLLAELLAR